MNKNVKKRKKLSHFFRVIIDKLVKVKDRKILTVFVEAHLLKRSDLIYDI